ncbi:hypothetical protein SAMN05877753_101396 [Bacillus oleivorans]|uniref:O-antigen ligase-like membrane protein n=1 Tax=Bacillus oleivorans TaxID=1448271 RepID=A0A285CHL2_9BACI|nr:hypothetical protein [Bacillus oleivorans]SNX67081.1 hypothetical protein SAMN05877753_101396 [Bacillus oleivorans]
MISRSIPRKYNVSSLEMTLFIISMVFTPQYLPIDIRPVVYIFWGMVGLYRGGMLTNLTRYIKTTMIILLVLTIYGAIIVLFNGSDQIYVFMRYTRALVALLVIWIYISSIKLDIDKITNSILIVLLIHSLIIIAEIIEPSVKDLMVPFAGVSRMFYPYRANGFVNSYDYAGLYTVLGFLLASYKYILNRNKLYLLITIVCVTATLFTSRLNIFLMSIVMIIVLIKSIKEKARLLSIPLLVIFFLVSTTAVFLWAITTDAIPGARDFIFNRFYWADQVYSTIRYTYPDNDIQEVIAYQFDLMMNLSLIFGSGIDGNVDPGYTQSIYSVGLIGTLIIVFYYIYQLFYIKYLQKASKIFDGRNLIFTLSFFLLIFNIVWNLKIWFFFSTSIFELTSILIIIYELSNKKITVEKNNYESKYNF